VNIELVTVWGDCVNNDAYSDFCFRMVENSFRGTIAELKTQLPCHGLMYFVAQERMITPTFCTRCTQPLLRASESVDDIRMLSIHLRRRML
jgi:hypothetical protein